MEYAQIKDKVEALTILKSRLVPLYKGSGKSYDQISKETGLVKKTLSDVFYGRLMPSMSTVFAIADCFNAPYSDIVAGLELLILPRGYHKRKTSDSILLEEEYEDLVRAEYDRYIRDKMERIRYFDAEDIGESLVIEDNSMQLLGLNKGYRVNFKKVSEITENGGIYVCRVKNEIIIRRVWVSNDLVILIPYTAKKDYEIIEASLFEVEILGVIISIDLAYNKTNNLL